ncbi:hypothetical protein [Spirulina sp. 06S082]|uniref:hypothetical protein n=1 Tax=Spirulina sp. 06S082 TaxID=3110248 RepID=UPI002B2013EA|nr:hypothetical protein [Spirulina sp. 06S082]MEA5468178.1 hypothetical protein [Spirulina sp. 06S082]
MAEGAVQLARILVRSGKGDAALKMTVRKTDVKKSYFSGFDALFLPVGNALAASVSVANGAILSGLGNAAIVRGDREIQLVAGMQLYPGDRFEVRSGEVLIQCADLALKTVTQGQVNPCLARDTVECTPGLRGCPDRGDNLAFGNATIPYIISPQNGKLLDSQPLLRWHPVAGGDRYRVMVEGGGTEWEQETSATQIQYGGEAL